MVVAVTAGCVSVGDDGGSQARPSHSAGRHGAAAGEGDRAGGGGVVGYADGSGRGGRDRGRHGGQKGGESASPSDSPSAGPGASASASASVRPGHSVPPGVPSPTGAPPVPTGSTPAQEPSVDPVTTAPPSPETSAAEPSSSAHGESLPRLGRREPTPRAGLPAL
nr:hypothetical protein [Streptomyces adustus]